MKCLRLAHPDSPTEPASNLNAGVLLSDFRLTFSLAISFIGFVSIADHFGYIDADLALTGIIQLFQFNSFGLFRLTPGLMRLRDQKRSRLLPPALLCLHEDLNTVQHFLQKVIQHSLLGTILSPESFFGSQ